MEAEKPSANKPRILIIEDDVKLLHLTQEFLETHGYQVSTEQDGHAGAERILSDKPDMVILDLMLPREDGLSVCRHVRPYYKGPILMLTAKTDDITQISSLEVGADDYVSKPVPPQVLLARTRALLRRIEHALDIEEEHLPPEVILGNIRIDRIKREVYVGGNLIDFTSAEFDLLWLLMLHAGKILTREDVLGTTRGIQYDGLDRTIDVRVSKIRKKIGDDTNVPHLIKTIRSKGYLFVKEPM